MIYRARKRILIVACRFDEDRAGGARPWRWPQAMAPVFLAGACNAETCDVRLYSELYSGPLTDPRLLGWPDMLVLTGLQVDFDRYLHLTAYARTLNPRVVVAAGGSIVELVPHFARRFFDYVCLGPVEELSSVVADAFGEDYASDSVSPRYDLAHWSRLIGAVESTRNCNFRCTFCTMSIQARDYQSLPLGRVRDDVLGCGRKHIFFLDNNFFGNDSRSFDARLSMLHTLRSEGNIDDWSAEVTADFFARSESLEKAKDAGCSALFCGVESMEPSTLLAFDKKQNTAADTPRMMKSCLERGIVFLYGLIFDPTRRSHASIEAELDGVLARPDLPLPSYFTLPIPLLGTPFFFQSLDERRILPGTRVRDLEGVTLCLSPLEGVSAFSRWWPDILRLRRRRLRALWHEARLQWCYRRSLGNWQRLISLGSLFGLCLPKYRRRDRTFVSSTEVLDPQYGPAFAVDPRFASYFEPTFVTDAGGELCPELSEVLSFRRSDHPEEVHEEAPKPSAGAYGRVG